MGSNRDGAEMKYWWIRVLCWSEQKVCRHLRRLFNYHRVHYAFLIAVDPRYLTQSDALILHSLGVAWGAGHEDESDQFVHESAMQSEHRPSEFQQNDASSYNSAVGHFIEPQR